MAAPTPRHRVALYNGVYVRHDAISDSLGHKLAILSDLADAGLPVDAVVFTHHTDSDDPRVHRARGTADVLGAPEFWQSDLHWYEFGIAYELFNTCFLVPRDRPWLAAYHNVTPPELVTDPVSRRAVERSMAQRHNLSRADHVACVSEFNRDDLLALGLAPEKMSVLHLPPGVSPTLEARVSQAERDADQPVRLLFVGRFVRAKGLVDLVEAVAAVLKRGVNQFFVTLVGNPEFADQPTRAELEGLRLRHGLSEHVSIAGRVEDPELAALYRATDALVLPSYHEGYCVPVVEAFSAGCFVITSDAGNLPAVVGGLGTLVPVGDVAALADAIEGFVAATLRARASRTPAVLATGQGPMPEDRWRQLVAAHLQDYSLANYRRRVVSLLGRFLPSLAAHEAWPQAAAAVTTTPTAAPVGAT